MEFTESERKYVVENHETDLLLTEVGLRLVDTFSASCGIVTVEATEAEVQAFLDELRCEFIGKISRIAHPAILRGLARRLLPDYSDLIR